MFAISSQQLTAMTVGRMSALQTRIDCWLCEMDPAWARQPAELRLERLRKIMRRAAQAGMDVETDYALFARIALDAEGGERLFFARDDVEDILRDDCSAQAKILRLDHIARAEPVEALGET